MLGISLLVIGVGAILGASIIHTGRARAWSGFY